MKVPLLPVLASFAAGLWVADGAPFNEFPTTGLLLLGILAVFSALQHLPIAGTASILSIFLILGGAAIPQSPPPQSNTFSRLESEKPALFDGWVSQSRAHRFGQGRSVVTIQQRCGINACQPAQGQVQLTFEGSPPQEGSLIRFRSRLLRFEAPGNAQGYDPRDKARRLRLVRRGFVRAGDWLILHGADKFGNAQTSPTPNNAQTQWTTRATLFHHITRRLHTLRTRWRTHIRSFYLKAESEAAAGLMIGLTLGDRDAISEELRETFARAGLAHLLAISGAHFAVAAIGCEWLARMLLLSIPGLWKYISISATAPILALIPTVAYAWLAGPTPSIWRALLMAIATISLRAGGRRPLTDGVLSLAMMGVLILSPSALWDIGFQLSVTSVLALIHLTPLLERGMTRLITSAAAVLIHRPPTPLKSRNGVKLIRGLAATMAASLGSAPLSAYYFQCIPLSAPLSNLIAAPILGAISLPLVLLSAFSCLVGIPGAVTLRGLAAMSLDLGIRVARVFGDTELAPILDFRPTPLETALAISLLFLVWLPGRRLRTVGASLCLVSLVWCSLKVSPTARLSRLTMTQLDVGQGDCSVLELPNGQVMVVDGGGPGFGSRSHFDPGRSILLPFLRVHGWKRIDVMVLSHAHPDHIGGLESALEELPVGALWLGELPEKAGRLHDLISLALSRGVDVQVLEDGDQRTIGQTRFEVLHPSSRWKDSMPRRRDRSLNNGSLVLTASYGDTDILLTGDIEHAVETQLVQGGRLHQMEIVKAPHHGSDTSSTAPFVTMLHPKIVLFGVGRENRFRFPRWPVSRRWQQTGAHLYRTDQDGAITISTDGTRLWVSTEGPRPRAQRILSVF